MLICVLLINEQDQNYNKSWLFEVAIKKSTTLKRNNLKKVSKKTKFRFKTNFAHMGSRRQTFISWRLKKTKEKLDQKSNEF
jgi:hypothetical protein